VIQIQQVWVIQCKSTGHFLTTELGYCTSLKGAGRLHDYDEALETASGNLENDFELHTFYQVDQRLLFEGRYYG
jgi:hypothetical protein